MKILYVTARWDPYDPDSGAGVNYNLYASLKTWADDLEVIGPFADDLNFIEKGVDRVTNLLFNKRLIKFYPSYIKKSNQIVNDKIAEYQPDVVISKASIPLVNVKMTMPFIYICDSSVNWIKNEWPHFSKFGFRLMEKWEAKVIQKANHIVTFSQANADVLQSFYNKPENEITVHPIPSSLPPDSSGFEVKQFLPNQPIRLLLVGKRYHGKGVDIAIKTTQLLNENGIQAQLRVVGQDGTNSEHIQFMGLYSKKDPQQLEEYMDQYRWAHFLIFPSRFDAAGIVASEAAGFGVPSITNDIGGLSTTVKDGVSGVVLKKNSPAEAYFHTIQNFINNPTEYENLCQSTYEHYQSTLNWDVLGNLIKKIITQTVYLQ